MADGDILTKATMSPDQRACHDLLCDQCVDAGVPFHLKQWGEWAPYGQYFPAPFNGLPGKATKVQHWFADGTFADHVGTKAAGRLLDGRVWDEFPRVETKQ